jgi:hypothetical protein
MKTIEMALWGSGIPACAGMTVEVRVVDGKSLLPSREKGKAW